MTLIESSDKDKLVNYFKRIDFNFDNDALFAHTIQHFRKEADKEYYCIYLIFNRHNKYSKITYGIIVHEAVHAVEFIFNYINEGKTEESFAYLTEYVVKEICEFLKIKYEI